MRAALLVPVLALACNPTREGNTPTPTPPPPPPTTLLERLSKEWNAVPAGTLNVHPAPDAERDAAIKKRFGEQCRLERTCGPLWGVDCDAAVDGPYYYVRVKPTALEEITTCGGACMGGRCTNCPPKNEGWTCSTY